MANNAIGGHLQGLQAAASHNNMAFSQIAAGGIGAGPKGPVLERYHSGSGDDGWMKSKGKKNNGIALSALTLLAFLFFLNILQNCLQEHMDDMKGKGKGNYYVQPSFNITIPVSRRSSEERSKSKKGDTGDDFVLPETDNSLEIDNYTGEEAQEAEQTQEVEQRIVPEHKYAAKRRMYAKKKAQQEKKKKEKVNTLYNINV